MIFLRKRIYKNMSNYSNTLLRELINNKVTWIICTNVIINTIKDQKHHKRNNKLRGLKLIAILILVNNYCLLKYKIIYSLIKNSGLMQIRHQHLCSFQNNNNRNVPGQEILIFLLILIENILKLVNDALL